MTARAELVTKRLVVCSAITNASGAAYCPSKPGHLHRRQQTGTVQACAAFAGWIELGVEKNTTVIFPAPLMSAIDELARFLARESAATKPTQFAEKGVPVAMTER